MKALTWGELKKQMEQAGVSNDAIILIPNWDWNEGAEEPGDIYFESAIGLEWQNEVETGERGIAIC